MLKNHRINVGMGGALVTVKAEKGCSKEGTVTSSVTFSYGRAPLPAAREGI